MDIKIRLETADDHAAVEELTREAFWNLYMPGCNEHYLVHTMRSSPDFLPGLAYVAEYRGEIVGSILYTKSYVLNENGEKQETVTFGPLCVHPKFQRKGIGSVLITFTKKLVITQGYPAIIIFGDPHNYCKHGFKNGKDLNIGTKDGQHPLGLLVLELKSGAFSDHTWRFFESDAFEVDMEPLDDFDQKFPPKEKGYQYSQEIFSMIFRSTLE